MGLTNVKVMMPFCRTLDGGRGCVVRELAQNGLVRGENGLEVYVMCEIPSNVILLAEFAEHFDGFSIGSNDLTQLTLGRRSRFRDRGPRLRRTRPGRADADRAGDPAGAAPAAGRSASAARRRATIRTSPRFLVECGIDSISLNPDAVLPVTRIVAAAEATPSTAAPPVPAVASVAAPALSAAGR